MKKVYLMLVLAAVLCAVVVLSIILAGMEELPAEPDAPDIPTLPESIREKEGITTTPQISNNPPISGFRGCSGDSDCAWASGLPKKYVGCGCFNKNFVDAIRENGTINECPCAECEPPAVEKLCVCDEDECRVNIECVDEACTEIRPVY